MKKLLVLGLTLAMASLASASELWWTIGDDAGNFDWDTAVLMKVVNGTNEDGSPQGSVISHDDFKEGFALGAYSGSEQFDSTSSFYIELQKSNEQRVAGSQIISGSALAAYNGGMSAPGGVYEFSGFTSDVVPEPTTGLLMLFGLAGLALKRRRA